MGPPKVRKIVGNNTSVRLAGRVFGVLGDPHSARIANDPMQRRPSMHGGRHWGPSPITIDTYPTLFPFPA